MAIFSFYYIRSHITFKRWVCKQYPYASGEDVRCGIIIPSQSLYMGCKYTYMVYSVSLNTTTVPFNTMLYMENGLQKYGTNYTVGYVCFVFIDRFMRYIRTAFSQGQYTSPASRMRMCVCVCVYFCVCIDICVRRWVSDKGIRIGGIPSTK